MLKNKEKIFAVIVLIALAVIFVPMIINLLPTNPVHLSTLPQSPVELTAESLPHAKVPNTEIEIAVNAAALNPPSKVTIQTQEEPPLTHTKPVAAEPIQSQPSQIMPLEKTKKTNKANKKNKAKKTGIEHGVAIQLGAFGYPEHAQDLIHKLKKQNYPAYSRKSHDSKRILTLVYVGPFLVRDEALSMMANIEAHFALKGIMVKYHAVENEE